MHLKRGLLQQQLVTEGLDVSVFCTGVCRYWRAYAYTLFCCCVYLLVRFVLVLGKQNKREMLNSVTEVVVHSSTASSGCTIIKGKL